MITLWGQIKRHKLAHIIMHIIDIKLQEKQWISLILPAMHHKLHWAETVESQHSWSNSEEKNTAQRKFACLKFASLAFSCYQ